MANLRQQASSVKRAGRKGDKHLLHISEEELLALLSSGKITRNPKTGLPEAFGLSGFRQSLDRLDNSPIFHPAENVFDDRILFDPVLQGDVTPSGEVRKGSYVDKKNQNLGLTDVQPVVNMFAKMIFGSAGASAAGGGGDFATATPGGGESIAPASSAGGDSMLYADSSADTLQGGSSSQNLMPAATPEPAGGPTAYGGSASTAMMPPAVQDPAAFSANQGGGMNPNGITGEGLQPGAPVAGLDSTFGPSLANSNLDGGTTAFGEGSPFGESFQGDLSSSFNTGDAGGTATNDPSWLEKFRQGLTMKNAGNSLTMGSGLYGLYLANQTKKMANNAYKGDPHRSQYEDQLYALMNDPSSVANMPGYQFGLDQGRLAIQRQGAASGSGGNEAIALARFTPAYAQAAYQAQVAQLMNAARSGQPSNAQLQGHIASSELVSRALASMGYGMQMMS